jgi:hypothetical protein
MQIAGKAKHIFFACWYFEKAKHIFFLTLEQSSFLLVIMFSCMDVQKNSRVFHCIWRIGLVDT